MSPVIGVRLSHEERQRVERAATAAGLSMSEYGRTAMLEAAAAAVGPDEPGEPVPTDSFKDTAKWLAAELAAAATAAGVASTVTEAKGWFTVSAERANQAVLIIRFGESYLRPLFTMPESRCESEAQSGRWPAWKQDSSSHVRRDGPTFRSFDQLANSMPALRDFAVAAARHVR